MKKTKIIVPALGMLLLSTAASVTGTVAWFAVNTSVTVTGLQVRAKAEGGIVIAPYQITKSSVSNPTGEAPNRTNTKTDYAIANPDANAFKNTATNNLGLAELYPTSTSTAVTWYHATSDDVTEYEAAGDYTTLSGLTGDGKILNGNGRESGDGALGLYSLDQYFLYNKYRVKCTSLADSYGLYIRGIDVDVTGTNTAALNKSLRVAIKAGAGAVKFFAPLYAADYAGALNYYNGTAATANASIIKGAAYTSNNMLTATASEVVNAGIDLEIWVYYEGEDENLKTINADGVTCDQLNLEFTFATTASNS